MNGRMLWALLRKDLLLYFSNSFFAVVTVLALVFYAGVYFVMPAELDEALEMAVFAPDNALPLLDELDEEGIVLVRMESVTALETAVRDGDHDVGVVLSPNFAQNLALGERETVTIYFNAAFPDEFKELYVTMFREIGFTLSGRPLNIEVTEEILGVDRAGSQIPYRDRMLPLFAVLVLVMEMMGLASLITNEISSGTLEALLVTPLRVEGLFVAKGTFGVGLALTQVVVLMAITGGLNRQPLLILLALLLGSVMVTGLGFLIASVATDLLSVMGWGMLGILALSLPAFAVLVPGLTTAWVKVIPSYYLVNTVHQIINYGWGWADAASDLLALLLFSLLFLGLGVLVLRRRFQ
jgi:ABC-2 type transport system permease protein